METILSTQYDSRQSFYNKAKVTHENGKIILTSYNTEVCFLEQDENGILKAVVKGTYSPTTLRHIKEFLKQNGFKAESKSQILTDYEK